jgi:hypothetical protein
MSQSFEHKKHLALSIIFDDIKAHESKILSEMEMLEKLKLRAKRQQLMHHFAMMAVNYKLN